MSEAGRPAVFLDRDGTLNEEVDFLRDPAELRLLPGAADAVRRLNEAGLVCVVVTNQSGIARGLLDEVSYVARRAQPLQRRDARDGGVPGLGRRCRGCRGGPAAAAGGVRQVLLAARAGLLRVGVPEGGGRAKAQNIFGRPSYPG